MGGKSWRHGLVAPGCRLCVLQMTAASFGDRLFCGFDHEICWARDYNELLCSIVIEKHIMYDCDRKCVVHLTQFSVF